MPTITAVLKTVAPSANAAFIVASGNAGAIMEEFGITSPNAQAQLIGHMAVECAGFRTFAESLNYSAARLTQVWPSRFRSIADASPYAKNPQRLANKVYNGRMGNRPNSDDGWNYRGSGGLQHTGRSEFERVNRRTGLDVVNVPDRLRDVASAEVMWRAACSYFVDRGCIAPADKAETEAVCKKVNGGLTGLSDRKIMVTRATHALMGLTIMAADKTTHEEADDTKRKAQIATGAAPAGAASGAGTTDQATAPKSGTTVPADQPKAPAPSTDHTAAIIVGVVIFVLVGLVAIAFWRKHFAKVAEIETTQLQAKQDRLAMAV